MATTTKSPIVRLLNGLMSQLAIVSLAVAIAFSIPYAVYLLGDAAPRKSALLPPMLLLTQLALALTLTLLFIGSRTVWRNRRRLIAAKQTGVIDVSEQGLRWEETPVGSASPASAEVVSLWTLSGVDMFSRPNARFHSVVSNARDIRVILLNPHSTDISTASDDKRAQELLAGIDESIRYLEGLSQSGKRVRLKFSDSPPIWKLGVVGDRIWVRYCHSVAKDKSKAEYLFAREVDNPSTGFFAPFYTYFLDHWDDCRYPELDFVTKELVYRNESGAEIRRMPLTQEAEWRKRERRTLRALSEPLSRFVSARVRAISSSIQSGAGTGGLWRRF